MLPTRHRCGGPVLAKRSAMLAIAVLALLAALAGCGSSRRTAAVAAPDTIVIRDFAFQPSTLVVAPGARVTVHNADPTTHTVTSTADPRAFDTGDIAAGTTVTFTAPTRSGSYPYICLIHQFMHGTLEVR